jgi:transposase-like protein
MGQRKRHSAALKAKVALEVIRGEKTANELAGLYQVHPTQISEWKKRAIEGMRELFEDGRPKDRQGDDVLKDRLYEEIGRLKVELDFLKKKSGLLG